MLIVAPPRTGKTVLLQKMANAISKNHPGGLRHHPAHRRASGRSHRHAAQRPSAEVVSSTFDEPASRHVQVADMVIEKARRLVEYGRDVVILLDSITRLARAHNTEVPHSQQDSLGWCGRERACKSRSVSSAPPGTSKKAAALTIIGTALVDTGSKDGRGHLRGV